MSKSTENTLLVPGESGWEIWSSQSDGSYQLRAATTIQLAGELKDLPSAEVTMFFPVKSLTAVPMRVSSDDDALFPDLAALHAERLGLRPDPMAGQLTDVFIISREAENTTLAAIFLRSPSEGELPTRGPKCFDISARAFPTTGDVLTVWKEFGRWVFAVHHHGTFVYCQATAVEAAQPDESLAREIRLSLLQLNMQGIDVQCSKLLVWSSQENIDDSALRAAFHATVEVSPRPAPSPPLLLSKLLPADVRAARRAALRRRNITFGVAAAALIYLSAFAWFGYGLWQGIKETQSLTAQAEAAAPDAAAYELHIAKWNELSHVIDLKNSPVDILNRIAACIPPNSGLRLKLAEVSATEIKLIGEAPALEAVNRFSLKLTNPNGDLSHFSWQTPESNQSTRGWEFQYTGEIPVTETQP